MSMGISWRIIYDCWQLHSMHNQILVIPRVHYDLLLKSCFSHFSVQSEGIWISPWHGCWTVENPSRSLSKASWEMMDSALHHWTLFHQCLHLLRSISVPRTTIRPIINFISQTATILWLWMCGCLERYNLAGDTIGSEFSTFAKLDALVWKRRLSFLSGASQSMKDQQIESFIAKCVGWVCICV